MVTSDDFWEAAYRRERAAKEAAEAQLASLSLKDGTKVGAVGNDILATEEKEPQEVIGAGNSFRDNLADNIIRRLVEMLQERGADESEVAAVIEPLYNPNYASPVTSTGTSTLVSSNPASF